MEMSSEERCRRLRSACGLSLTELVIVAMIIAIMASIAMQRFGNALARQRVDAAARCIVVDLQLAEREAKVTSSTQTVQSNSNAYELDGMPESGGPVVIQIGNHFRAVSIDPITSEASAQ